MDLEILVAGYWNSECHFEPEQFFEKTLSERQRILVSWRLC